MSYKEYLLTGVFGKAQAGMRQTVLTLAGIVTGYLLFFTSSVWLPDGEDAAEYSRIGGLYGLAGSTVTLVDWAYDPEKGEMSVEMDIENSSLSLGDSYHFSAVTKAWDELMTETVLFENGTCVVRISGVPSDFGAVSFRVSKIKQDGTTAAILRLYTNEDAVRYIDGLQFYDSAWNYYRNRIVRTVGTLEQQKMMLEAGIAAKVMEIEACELQIIQSRERLIYGGSRKQVEQMQKTVTGYENTLASLRAEKESLEDAVLETTNEIASLKQQLEEMEEK